MKVRLSRSTEFYAVCMTWCLTVVFCTSVTLYCSSSAQHGNMVFDSSLTLSCSSSAPRSRQRLFHLLQGQTQPIADSLHCPSKHMKNLSHIRFLEPLTCSSREKCWRMYKKHDNCIICHCHCLCVIYVIFLRACNL